MPRLARWLLLLLAIVAAFPATPLRASEAEAWASLARGSIALFRHANAPGGGDPAGMRLGDCTTQRNLDEQGRAQARRIGAAFRDRNIAVARVLTSQWCRTRETAELAFPGRAEDAPAFNSFFGDRAQGPAQTRAARALLQGWNGPGALVVSTHQVNITGLTGIVPASGEGVVIRFEGDTLQIVGRIKP
ncbi:MAG: histidine phosphatase family protein [Methylobacterium sp.]|nr:MAG: histidine phosphatase family protein [Methylobacterium sp.]